MTEPQGKKYWWRCPACGVLGSIDADQLNGRVSIYHDGCPWHKTGVVHPVLPDTVPLPVGTIFTITEGLRHD